jgi:hypothetical protein
MYVPAKENGRPGSFVLIWQVYCGLCRRIGGRVIYETSGHVKPVVGTTKFFMLLYLWMILSLTHNDSLRLDIATVVLPGQWLRKEIADTPKVHTDARELGAHWGEKRCIFPVP